MNIAELPSGRVIKREIVNGKHQKHIVVKVLRVIMCSMCGVKCKDKVIHVKMGNFITSSSCIACAEVEYADNF